MEYPTQTSPLSKMPVYSFSQKKRRIVILLSVAIGGLLIVSGAVIFGLWYLTHDEEGENPLGQTCVYKGMKYNDNTTFDAQDECNICTCKNGNVSCTLRSCLSHTPETGTEEWKMYTDQDNRISFQYPSDWSIEEGDYNAKSYKVRASNSSGYAITFEGNEDDSGDYCIYSDSDTNSLPSNYTQGIMGKIEFDLYTEFEQNYILYRIAQSPHKTNTYIVCEYNDHTNFFTTNISFAGFVTYTIPDENFDSEMIDILNLIFYSRK